MPSAVFRSVEGFDAADAEYPVIAPDGRFIGSVSLLFKPETFLENILHPLVRGLPVDIWVMEPGGRILFDCSILVTLSPLQSSGSFRFCL